MKRLLLPVFLFIAASLFVLPISPLEAFDTSCPICHGTGRCTSCFGSGGMRNFDGTVQPCIICQGSGVCQFCHGVQPSAPQIGNDDSGDDNTPPQDKTCNFCHGSGINPNPSYGPTYGTEQGEKYCDVCGRNVPDNHYHNTCPMCHGSGQRR